MTATVPQSSQYAGIGVPALDEFKKGANHLLHETRITLANGQMANTTLDDVRRYKMMTWYSKVQTTSTLSQLFVQSANRFFDFLIPQGTPDTLMGAYIGMTFANADAVNACQLPPSEFLFQEYQELSNGTDASVIFTPEQMWFLNSSWRGMGEYYHYGKMSNTVGNPVTATSLANLYSATDTVPASSTATCYLNLDFSPLIQARPFLPSITRQPRLRFYPNSNPWINSNVNGDVTLTDVQLTLWGRVYTPDVKERLMSVYRSTGTITRTFTIQSWQQQFTCTANSQVGPYVLTSIMGEMSALVFFIRSYEAAYNSTNLWTEATTGLIDWTYMSLKNGTSTPLWYENVERIVLRHHVPMISNPTLFSGAVPVYAFPHTVDLGKTLRQYSHYGGYNYNNTQTITITPSATATGASGTANLYVWGLRYSAMLQNSLGQLFILRF